MRGVVERERCEGRGGRGGAWRGMEGHEGGQTREPSQIKKDWRGACDDDGTRGEKTCGTREASQIKENGEVHVTTTEHGERHATHGKADRTGAGEHSKSSAQSWKIYKPEGAGRYGKGAAKGRKRSGKGAKKERKRSGHRPGEKQKGQKKEPDKSGSPPAYGVNFLFSKRDQSLLARSLTSSPSNRCSTRCA